MKIQTMKGSNIKASIPTPKLTELSDRQGIPSGHGVFRVLTEDDGDKRFAWNPRSIPEIAEARQFFKDCIAEGLVAYRVGTGGNATSESIDVFDPHAGEIIFRPTDAMVAGG